MNTARNDDVVEFIRLPDVKKLVGFSTTKIYEMAKEGTFPRQVRIGGNSVAWIKSEVLQWNLDQVAAARGHSANMPSDSR